MTSLAVSTLVIGVHRSSNAAAGAGRFAVCLGERHLGRPEISRITEQEHAMNDTWMTIVGNVVDEPRARETKNGHKVTNFRVASTSRRFDREQERYIDNATLYVSVTCWRAQAVNVAESLHKGQPVVVYGRYYTRDYRVEDQLRTSYELEATAVGHDLSRGVTTFKRVNRSAPPSVVAVDDQGIPSDESDRWLDLAEPEPRVDPATGEVLDRSDSNAVAASSELEAV